MSLIKEGKNTTDSHTQSPLNAQRCGYCQCLYDSYKSYHQTRRILLQQRQAATLLLATDPTHSSLFNKLSPCFTDAIEYA